MKKIVTPIIAFILFFITVTGCTPEKQSNDLLATHSSQTTSSQQEKKYVSMVSIESKSIAQNLINEPCKKEIVVSLPPSYFDNKDKKYPTVYFFHGFQEGPGVIGNKVLELKNRNQDIANEFIIIEVSGENKHGGSFYVNSPIIGNWEDFVIKEVIPYVDSNYRTIASKDSRGVSGFSMGGYACLNLALKHPEAFSSVYALSPGVFDENGLKDALKTWKSDENFKTGYGQAFCPMPNVPDIMTKIPTFDGSKDDNEIITKWESGFGDFNQKLDNYLQKKDKLKAINIQVGTCDSYPWIPNGCIYLSKIMKEKNIAHELITIKDCGHFIPSDFVETSFVSFFNKNLKH
ncbi:alpha/beta hydrolase-fold protein [Paludicola sp. MB14-C6]|uniref:alpha/beta hydrolase n=1 Tax=Paludihabitans sp. MB14-C6 TaxID=3070656 RepID=UPI0027DB035A|nr:alpha/beta hydrolase-fold protein [Paludicola sp. MB14-C6]WMJ21979.1 alpha/beta hydrolase-fold protein [Paludicola sp. MB14-C6]